jgi:hypothetical protein
LTKKSKEKLSKKLKRIAVGDQKKRTHNRVDKQTLKKSLEYKNIFSGHKQLLYIKSFIGTSQNALMVQIWTALITILILKHLRATAKYKWFFLI